MADLLTGEVGESGGAGDAGAASTAPQVTPASVINPDGTFSEGWNQLLPEDLRENPSLAGFKSLPDLAKSLVNTKRMVGADKERFAFIPNENSSPEERAEFYGKLGRPESPDKYEVKMPENLPAGMQVNEQMQQHFANIAHERGLNNDQFQAMIDGYTQYQVAQFEAQQMDMSAKFEDGVKALQQEWRGDYDKNLQIANRAVKEFGLTEFLEKKGLNNDPEMVKVMNKIGSMLLEDEGPAAGSVSGSATVQSQIDSIRADRNHPYHHKDMPGHAQAVDTMNKLYTKLV